MATYTVKPNQNLYDVALYLYGSIEGLFDLLISNEDINMTTDLVYGQELTYHEEFILNSTIVDEFADKSIVPASGARKVYFKRPEEDLIMIVGVNADMTYATFKASGEGSMVIDWGDNSELETITLSTSVQKVEHYFDNETEKRRVRIYGDNSTLKFIQLDTTGLGGALVMCRPLTVDEYTCVGCGYVLTGLTLFDGTYKVDLHRSTIANLLPIGDMGLQELDLTDARFVNDSAIDDYLEYVVKHYEDRRPCTVYLTTEPGARGYAAIDTILGEPEWNISDTWKFYINNQLYQSDGTNS
jgi:hypothetical protein